MSNFVSYNEKKYRKRKERHRRINEKRKKAGLPPLKYESEAAARKRIRHTTYKPRKDASPGVKRMAKIRRERVARQKKRNGNPHDVDRKTNKTLDQPS